MIYVRRLGGKHFLETTMYNGALEFPSVLNTMGTSEGKGACLSDLTRVTLFPRRTWMRNNLKDETAILNGARSAKSQWPL